MSESITELFQEARTLPQVSPEEYFRDLGFGDEVISKETVQAALLKALKSYKLQLPKTITWITSGETITSGLEGLDLAGIIHKAFMGEDSAISYIAQNVLKKDFRKEFFKTILQNYSKSSDSLTPYFSIWKDNPKLKKVMYSLPEGDSSSNADCLDTLFSVTLKEYMSGSDRSHGNAIQEAIRGLTKKEVKILGKQVFLFESEALGMTDSFKEAYEASVELQKYAYQFLLEKAEVIRECLGRKDQDSVLETLERGLETAGIFKSTEKLVRSFFIKKKNSLLRPVCAEMFKKGESLKAYPVDVPKGINPEVMSLIKKVKVKLTVDALSTGLKKHNMKGPAVASLQGRQPPTYGIAKLIFGVGMQMSETSAIITGLTSYESMYHHFYFAEGSSKKR